LLNSFLMSFSYSF